MNSDTNTPIISLNQPSHRLTREVIIEGKKVDPFTHKIGFNTFSRDANLLIKPSEEEGIYFCIGDKKIPYNSRTLTAKNTALGRMLFMKDFDNNFQIALVEHLMSAIHSLGLHAIEIHLWNEHRGLMTSKILKQNTYWVPVSGPGISGFVDQLKTSCVPDNLVKSVCEIIKKRTYKVMDEKYEILRSMRIEPSDRGEIEILSAHQPDIKNNPDAQTFCLDEDRDISELQNARPVMRLQKHSQAAVVFILNFLGSSMLTDETYFKSRPGLSKEEVVSRMHHQFQHDQNEHLVHTAVADFPSELRAIMGNYDLKWKITLQDTNHVFRLEALRALFGREHIQKS